LSYEKNSWKQKKGVFEAKKGLFLRLKELDGVLAYIESVNVIERLQNPLYSFENGHSYCTN